MSTMTRPEIVAITGASAGVGRATAQEFAKHGAYVGLIARGGAGQDGLEGARKDVEAAGGKALMLPTDVADPDQVEAAADRVEKELGPIDIWVNNAMTSVFAPLTQITPEEFRRVTEVTYLGQVYGTMAALRRMRPRDRGHIVQVGSALAYRSIPLQSAYCGAKAGIRGFTDALRCELIHEGSHVQLTMVQMPALNTPQFGWVRNKLPHRAQPVPPIYHPEIAAEAIYWAAHHNRRELYVGLSTLKAVIGNMAAPGLMDCYLARNGYKEQQADEPADPGRPDNLWEPVAGDHGAHGAFGSRSRSRSPELWVMEHSHELALAGAALVGLTCASLVRRSQ